MSNIHPLPTAPPVAQPVEAQEVTLGGDTGEAVPVYPTAVTAEERDRQYAVELTQQQYQQQQQFQQQQQQQSPDAPVRIPVAQQLKRLASTASILESDDYTPIFTYIMIVVDTLVLIAELVLNYIYEGVVIVSFAENPTIGPSSRTLIVMGAKVTDLILDDGEFWRLICPVFLHAGVVHLLLNMLFLWWFGAPLERAFGFCKVAYIYFASGFTGVVLSAIFLPQVVTVGASGACYGLIGATWADFILNCSYYRGAVFRTVCALGFGTVLNLAIGLLPMLDNFAHIGGFIGGFCVGLSVMARKRYNSRRQEKPERIYQIVCSLGCSFVAPLMILILVVMFYVETDTLQECDWCKYLSCVPTPWWSCELSCSTDHRYEPILSGPDKDSLLLTCPGGGETRIIPRPFPSLDTLEERIAECQRLCGIP